MKISPCSQLSFADQIVSDRKVKDVFFSQINQLIDWKPLARLIKQVYTKGSSSTGRPSYEGILLFKIELLRTWYDLSDPEVEEQIKDRLSFMRFLGLSLEDSVPDSTTICRFRNALVSGGLNDQLLFEVNRQLEAAGVIIKSGVIVDASVTDSPRRPRGRKSYTMVDDRNEEVGYKEAEAAHFEECTHSNVDGEARWLKKGGQSHYGYKRHTATDENGLILAEVTTPANQSDIKNLNSPLDKLDLPQDTLVLADKGYRSAESEAYLKARKLRSGLMHRAQKDKPLTSSEKTLNRLISSSRYVVERTFGSIKRWFSGGTARYVGLSKMHMQHTLEAIAYNLYRSPGIIVSDFLPIALKLQKRESLICLQKACS